MVSSDVVKGVASYLYDIFMFYIPQHMIENLVDNALVGSTSLVMKTIVNGDAENKLAISTQTLNHLSHYMHNRFHSKDIYLGDAELLKYLQYLYNQELKGVSNPDRYKLYQKNKIEVSYSSNNMRHRLKLEFDLNWKILPGTAKQYTEEKET